MDWPRPQQLVDVTGAERKVANAVRSINFESRQPSQHVVDSRFQSASSPSLGNVALVADGRCTRSLGR
jgi:hypothetical protein